ncbi:tyrosine--tRNA ligase [Malassezia equina]|uniref:Tyrosine--tRNA ligase n=1 Tax=Malassezia equina TaxID=1381935 RepID=A0AAF0IZ70_9BASI|nr:tyrosine--tRNA ligase [Malassezia equina]
MLHLVTHGHHGLILVRATKLMQIGGATGAIGDPSGRSTERSALDTQQLEKNVSSIRSQIYQFFHNAVAYLQRRGRIHATPAPFSATRNSTEAEPLFLDTIDLKLINNLDWFRNVSALHFLAEVGRFARVNEMMARESSGMSFTEFSYQLMQAHDFSLLHKERECSVQVGGSDQMGNIMAGIDLIRRQKAAQHTKKADNNMREDPAYGLTLPLLTTSTGAKFGKSAGNAVWISQTMLSDFDFYQYFVRSADADVERYLFALTLLSKEEIQEILSKHAENKAKRFAQVRLAEEMTELVRGEDALQRARLATETLFGTDVQSLTLEQVEFAFKNDNRLVRVPRESTDILRLAADVKLVSSRSTF